MLGFNAGIADEPVKGCPKFIRTVTIDLVQESEFDPQGKLIEKRTFRPDGSLSYRHTDQDESAAGAELDGNTKISYQPFFDAHGSFIGADVHLNEITVETRQEGDRTTAITYGSDRTILSRSEVSRTGDTATCLTTLPYQRRKTERIEQRDNVGNWILKSLFESGDPDEIGELVSTVERTITYFEDVS